ncbi:MAG: deoxyribose-phosphate aldolase [Elusimicrobia bacterium RIFCSPLOWO2_01_FULL_60_11]|nr:MAG: deoxyribose-phosphate aldolase [Elusimicrobia bacterium RIFCSPLOWO2_01_FULL_60_11]
MPNITSCCEPCGAAARSLASRIDHTCLKPEATEADIRQLCAEARRHGFAAVCVNPVYVRLARECLSGSRVKVCSVVGFPFGAQPSASKAFEARRAVRDGADEIDMVIHVGALKSKAYESVRKDIREVREAAEGKILKVIVEAALLTKEELVRASIYARDAGADFVKTGTGFAPRGVSLEDVRIIRETVGPHIKIKAAGGIKSRSQAEGLIAAGADRLGASSSVDIVAHGGGGEHG